MRRQLAMSSRRDDIIGTFGPFHQPVTLQKRRPKKGAKLPEQGPGSLPRVENTPVKVLVAAGSYGHLHGGCGHASQRPVTLLVRFSIVENQTQVTEIE